MLVLIVTIEKAAIQVDKATDLAALLFDLCVRTSKSLLQCLVEFWRQLQVFVLHRKPSSDQVVEAELSHERRVELSVLKLLTEGN